MTKLEPYEFLIDAIIAGLKVPRVYNPENSSVNGLTIKLTTWEPVRCWRWNVKTKITQFPHKEIVIEDLQTNYYLTEEQYQDIKGCLYLLGIVPDVY